MFNVISARTKTQNFKRSFLQIFKPSAMDDEVLKSPLEEEDDPIPALINEGREEQSNQCNITMIVLAANIGTLLFGYEVGAISWVLYNIALVSESDDTEKYYSIVEDSSVLIGLIGSAASLGAALFYPLLLFFGNNVSKKDEILLAALLFFVGGLMTSLSSDMNWEYVGGLVVLLIGRLIYGFGIASSIHAIPQYISEVVPANVRGQYGATVELTVVTGMALGFGIGYAFEVENKFGWTVLFRFAYCLAILMGVLSVFLPHNPVWLVHNHHSKEDILVALRFVYPLSTEVSVDRLIAKTQEDLALLQAEERASAVAPTAHRSTWVHWTGLYNCLTPQLKLIVDNRLHSRCMQIKVHLHVLKILTGQTAILYYNELIFNDLYPDHVEEFVYGYILNRLCFALIMIFVADLIGRRHYMLSSSGLMFAGMLVTTIGFATDSRVVTTLGLYGSGVGFQIGFGSISYVVLNEVVPYSIRSTVNAVANCLLFSAYFVVTFIFPYLSEIIGYTYVFLIFALLNVYAFYYIYVYLPETQGIDMNLAYKLVDDKFNSAPECCCCDDRSDLDEERSGASRSEISSLLHSD